MRYAPTLSGDMTLDLPEFTEPPTDPVPLLRDWITAAEAADVREPRSATLATADADGRVSARTVSIKDISDAGVLFGLTAGSRKGRDLAGNPWAALNFYWRERAQQICISGPVTQAADSISDILFAGRPLAAQALASSSDQSQPMTDPQRLRSEVDRLAATGAVVRPASWSAWALALDEIEFWHGSTDRFHRRLHYLRDGDRYDVRRLQP